MRLQQNVEWNGRFFTALDHDSIFKERDTAGVFIFAYIDPNRETHYLPLSIGNTKSLNKTLNELICLLQESELSAIRIHFCCIPLEDNRQQLVSDMLEKHPDLKRFDDQNGELNAQAHLWILRQLLAKALKGHI